VSLLPGWPGRPLRCGQRPWARRCASPTPRSCVGPESGGVRRHLLLDTGTQMSQGSMTDTMKLRRRGRPCGLPALGWCREGDAGEKEEACQGALRFFTLHGLQQEGQGPGTRGGARDRDPAQCGDARSQQVNEVQAR